MRVCEAFARERIDVEMWAPKRRNTCELKEKDPFVYHAIDPVFPIKYLPVIDVMPYSAVGRFSFYLMLGSFVISIFFKMLFMRNRKNTIFYFFDLRDAVTAHFLSNKTFSEIHMYYRSSLGFINHRGFRRMNGIIAATKALKSAIQNNYAVPDRKILHAPCGVNFERFGIDTSIQKARTSLGLPQDRRIILYVGHLFPVKGVDVLFEAHTGLRPGEYIYFVGGTNEDIARFKQKWHDAGSPDNVVIVGHRPHQEIPLWLRAADILSIPNTAKEDAGSIESSPSKLIEYMASGRPIIASDVPGITDVMDGTMGYLVQPDSPDAIVHAIHGILDGSREATQCAKRARAASKNLSWEARARKIKSFIETLVGTESVI